ncbi:MAG: dihydroneopterin aldolase [Azospirillaceae bacterium]
MHDSKLTQAGWPAAPDAEAGARGPDRPTHSARPAARHGLARDGVRHLFVRDLVVPARIGIYDREKQATQRVAIDLDLEVEDRIDAHGIADVVSYEPFVVTARQMALETHTALVETLAERLAAFCLQDTRVFSVRVRVEKLDVFPDAAGVGVEILRRRG